MKKLELNEACKAALTEYQDAVNRLAQHKARIKETTNKILLAENSIQNCHASMSDAVIGDESFESIIKGKEKIRQHKYEIEALLEIKADFVNKLEELNRLTTGYELGVIGERECYWRHCYKSLINIFDRAGAERILCCAYNANLPIRDVIEDMFNQREDNPDYSLVSEYQNQLGF